MTMRLSYVLPDPASYRDWSEFEGDLACMKRAGYDAVELQIADPAEFDEDRVGRSLAAAGYAMCAFQTGSTYSSRGNCLCTADEAVRRRTIELLKSFVALAARWRAVMVFGSLQGRLSDEPDRAVGARRIREAIREIGQYASQQKVTIAFEPVQQGEVGFHNTIAEVAELVRGLDLPGVRMMIDSFHMNIEEKDMFSPLPAIRDILAHVHLCETNRDVLGAGHWPTAAFLDRLEQIGYQGCCSIGVYHTRLPRRQCIEHCVQAIANPQRKAGQR
ncbi:MAG: sugar phosphate isomerase/epimerase family protein [Thermoguttaceae bacterium]|jgi:sugar phosphate isomerase/epimerase